MVAASIVVGLSAVALTALWPLENSQPTSQKPVLPIDTPGSTVAVYEGAYQGSPLPIQSPGEALERPAAQPSETAAATPVTGLGQPQAQGSGAPAAIVGQPMPTPIPTPLSTPPAPAKSAVALPAGGVPTAPPAPSAGATAQPARAAASGTSTPTPAGVLLDETVKGGSPSSSSGAARSASVIDLAAKEPEKTPAAAPAGKAQSASPAPANRATSSASAPAAPAVKAPATAAAAPTPAVNPQTSAVKLAPSPALEPTATGQPARLATPVQDRPAGTARPAAAALARVTIVAVSPDGTSALVTDPNSRLPTPVRVGQQLHTGETVQGIDAAAGEIKTDARIIKMD